MAGMTQRAHYWRPTAPHPVPISMSSRTRFIATALLGAFITSLSCMKATANAEGAPLTSIAIAPPRLVVFITVDQLRGDMLDRYRNDLRYGFARLMRGAWFVNGFQDHAITETAPGHASTMSGRFPRSTGIVSNLAGVNDSAAHLIGSAELGASPTRFRGST